MDFNRPRSDSQRDQYERDKNHEFMNRTFSIPTDMCDARQADQLHQGGGRVTNVALESVLQGRTNVNLDYLSSEMKEKVLQQRRYLVQDMLKKERAINLNDCGRNANHVLAKKNSTPPKAERQKEFNHYHRITSDALFVPCYKTRIGSMEAPIDSRSWLKDHLSSPDQLK